MLEPCPNGIPALASTGFSATMVSVKKAILPLMLAPCAVHGEVEQHILPIFDAARTYVRAAGGFDAGAGDMETFDFVARAAVTPKPRLGDWWVVPFFEYRYTSFDVDGAPAAFPTDDIDLHSLSLSSFFVRQSATSPWLYGGWASAELASDFQHVDGDDFTFDLAAGVGYRFSERFTLVAGAAVVNLNADPEWFPGINFDWKINDCLSAGIYGPSGLVVYKPHENWMFTLRGDPAGGLWNITDNAGDSRSLDWSAYRAGAYVSHRLAGHLWLTAGGGAVFSGDFDRTTPAGRTLASADPGTGWFGLLGLRLMAW